MSKSLPRVSTDNKIGKKLYSYEVLRTPTKVFVDPLLPDKIQRAVYVETISPIPVKPMESEGVVDKVTNVVKSVTGKSEDSK